GVSILDARALPSYTLTATIRGYLLGIGLIPRAVSQKRMLQICTVLGLLLSLLVCLSVGRVCWFHLGLVVFLWFLALLGLPNAVILAGIWPLALTGLGPHAKQGSALLIMGLCGNAILPLIYGAIADITDVKTAYWVLIPCFLYLVFYAFKGYAIRPRVVGRSEERRVGKAYMVRLWVEIVGMWGSSSGWR